MLLQIISTISDFLWGTPMTVALVGTGLYLGIRFGFRYNFRKIGFNFRNTFGKMFKKGEGTGTASGFAAIGKLFNSLFGFDYMISMLSLIHI